MLKADIEAVMAEWPGLTRFGFFTPEFREHPSDREARKVEERAEMLTPDAIEQFKRCREYITANLESGPRVNPNVSSYGLKHRVERWYRERGNPAVYVSNGMFIAAMVSHGFRVCRIDGPNCFFNITPSSMKRSA